MKRRSPWQDRAVFRKVRDMRELQQGATSCKPAVSLWGKFEIGDLVRGGGFMWERVKWGRWFTMVPGKRRLRLYVVGDGPDIWWLMVRAKAKADAPRRDKHGFATVHRERCPSSEDVFRRAREVVNLLVHGRRPNARPLDTVRRKEAGRP